MSSSPKLTPEQVTAARESGHQYEANMAIEGMVLTDEERQFFKQLDDDAIGYNEGVQRTLKMLKAKGIIPAMAHVLAAE